MKNKEIIQYAERIAELEKKYLSEHDSKESMLYFERECAELLKDISFEDILAIDDYICQKNLINKE